MLDQSKRDQASLLYHCTLSCCSWSSIEFYCVEQSGMCSRSQYNVGCWQIYRMHWYFPPGSMLIVETNAFFSDNKRWISVHSLWAQPPLFFSHCIPAVLDNTHRSEEWTNCWETERCEVRVVTGQIWTHFIARTRHLAFSLPVQFRVHLKGCKETILLLSGPHSGPLWRSI